MSRLRLVACLLLVPAGAAAESDFWAEVRRPGIGTYRQAFAEGRVLFEQRRLRESLDAFERASRALDDEAEGHLWQGNVLYELGRWREAVDAWDRARDLDPRLYEDGTHTFQTAIALSRLLDFPRAVAEYERMISRLGAADGDELRAVVFANCAESLMALGPDHLEVAVRYYRRSLEQMPDYDLAHWGLAVALDRQGSEAEARQEARRAVEDDERMMALVTGGVFFVPDYEIHWYRALGHEVRLQLDSAQAEWSAYLAMGGTAGPWRTLAERRLERLRQPGGARSPATRPQARASDPGQRRRANAARSRTNPADEGPRSRPAE